MLVLRSLSLVWTLTLSPLLPNESSHVTSHVRPVLSVSSLTTRDGSSSRWKRR